MWLIPSNRIPGDATAAGGSLKGNPGSVVKEVKSVDGIKNGG